jgi:hypothetical protein
LADFGICVIHTHTYIYTLYEYNYMHKQCISLCIYKFICIMSVCAQTAYLQAHNASCSVIQAGLVAQKLTLHAQVHG